MLENKEESRLPENDRSARVEQENNPSPDKNRG